MELNQTSKPRNETIRIKFNNIFLENILKKNSREIRATLSVVDTLFKIRGVPRFRVTRKNSGGLGRDRDTSSDFTRLASIFAISPDVARNLPTRREIQTINPAQSSIISPYGIIIKIWPT